MRQQGRQPDSQATLSRTSRLPESTDDATATRVARLYRGAAVPLSFLRKVIIMSKEARVAAGPIARSSQTMQPACGSVRVCVPYAGELARHRLISADGCDYVVATVLERGRSAHYVTGAYPVTRGYLVMLRQPLCEIRSEHAGRARREHDALVQVLAEAGVSVVRARRLLAARQRAERAEAVRAASRPTNISFLVPAYGGAEDPVALSELAALAEAAESAPELTEPAAIN